MCSPAKAVITGLVILYLALTHQHPVYNVAHMYFHDDTFSVVFLQASKLDLKSTNNHKVKVLTFNFKEI